MVPARKLPSVKFEDLDFELKWVAFIEKTEIGYDLARFRRFGPIAKTGK
jgi:hypothetical protein